MAARPEALKSVGQPDAEAREEVWTSRAELAIVGKIALPALTGEKPAATLRAAAAAQGRAPAE